MRAGTADEPLTGPPVSSHSCDPFEVALLPAHVPATLDALPEEDRLEAAERYLRPSGWTRSASRQRAGLRASQSRRLSPRPDGALSPPPDRGDAGLARAGLPAPGTRGLGGRGAEGAEEPSGLRDGARRRGR